MKSRLYKNMEINMLNEEEFFGDVKNVAERINKAKDFIIRAETKLKNNEMAKSGKPFGCWTDISNEKLKELLENAYELKEKAKELNKRISLRKPPFDKMEAEKLQNLRTISNNIILFYKEQIYKNLINLQYYIDKYNETNGVKIPSIEEETGLEIKASVPTEESYFNY